MKHLNSGAWAGVLALMLSACSTTTHSLEKDRNYWMTYSDTMRGAYVINGKFCDGPPVDVTKNTQGSGASHLGVTPPAGQAGVDIAAGGTLAIESQQLSGRTQYVLMLREFMYRMCEAKANNPGDSTVADTYQKVLTVILNASQADLQSSKTSLVKAVKDSSLDAATQSQVVSPGPTH